MGIQAPRLKQRPLGGLPAHYRADNPLTARVFVIASGTGFLAQASSQPPTTSATLAKSLRIRVLDYLANQFINEGWSIRNWCSPLC